MKINDVELSLDVSNPEELTAASRFIDETREIIAGCQGRKFVDQVSHVHRAVSGCFDRLYGPGVGARVCGDRPSGIKAVTAVCEFAEEYWRQIDHMEEIFKRTAACWDRFDRQAEKMGSGAPSEKRGDTGKDSGTTGKENLVTPLAMLPQKISGGGKDV